jgi:hypothetical protein
MENNEIIYIMTIFGRGIDFVGSVSVHETCHLSVEFYLT